MMAMNIKTTLTMMLTITMMMLTMSMMLLTGGKKDYDDADGER